ncbi:MAG: glycerate kinase [Archangiaceae bacterium]|nr:glycerate kinase [Archangiaceae bacterium]
MGLRALVAPQQFKGTLTARAAAEAISRGLTAALPDCEIDLAPLADGGLGTVDALMLARENGEERTTEVHGPLGSVLRARWGLFPAEETGTQSAVLETAAASGLLLVPPEQRSILDSTTRGTGELIRAALDAGCTVINLGLGDSATCDGGVGAVTALGARFLDAKGQPLPPGPRHLEKLERIDLTGLDPRLKEVQLQLLTDVLNPLLGELGTARIYAPQKGADEGDVEHLEGALQHLARVVQQTTGHDLRSAQGAGAAGGLAFGLTALCGAKMARGFDVVSEAMGLFQRIGEADVVITGEGQLDVQTTFAKGPFSLGRLARMQKKRVIVFAGQVSNVTASVTREAFDEVIQVGPPGCVPAAGEAGDLLAEAVRAWAAGRRRNTTEMKKP